MSGAHDPFRAGPDVEAYVRNRDFEQSCEYLSAKLLEAPTWVGICGPPGVGKTLLARLLLRRLARQFTVVHVPASDLTPAETERWIAAQLAARDASFAALAVRLAGRHRPLLVALDEAQHASPELVTWLASWCNAESAGRAVLVWNEEEGARRPAALARCPARVFVEPLGLADVTPYVEAQLARAGASAEQRATLAGRTLDRIALASGGNPRIIQRLADAELAAQAWREQRDAKRTRGAAPASERSTASAPRGALRAGAPGAEASRKPRGAWLVAAAALALVAGAALFLR